MFVTDDYLPLSADEFHPVSEMALRYIKKKPINELLLWQEAFSSAAMSGDIGSLHCEETLSRIMRGLPVGERYVLAVAFVMQQGE